MINRLGKIFLLIAISLPFIADAKALPENTLVGVFPFTNQRTNNNSADWIGSFIQARIESNLRQNSSWRFHNLRTLQIWKNSAASSFRGSEPNTIIISGSYQQVADIGVINIVVSAPQNGVIEEKHYNDLYPIEEILEKLDALCLKVGMWIDSDYKQPESSEAEELDLGKIRNFYALVAQAHAPDSFPESRLIIDLMDGVNGQSPTEMIAGLSEAMLILSSQLVQKERESLIFRVEALLKASLQKYRTNAELYALLAETYYLRQSYTEWVEKTAKEALSFDDRNDLALLLLLLVSDDEVVDMDNYVDRLKQVNPYLWLGVEQSPLNYQKGLIGDELLKLGKRLGQI